MHMLILVWVTGRFVLSPKKGSKIYPIGWNFNLHEFIDSDKALVCFCSFAVCVCSTEYWIKVDGDELYMQ